MRPETASGTPASENSPPRQHYEGGIGQRRKSTATGPPTLAHPSAGGAAGENGTVSAHIASGRPAIFIVKNASDQDCEEEPDIIIYAVAALMELAGGLQHELVLSRNLLRDHPVILVGDAPAE